MARRWIAAVAGVAIGVALVATPAVAQPPPPITKMTFRLDAREVLAGEAITGSVQVSFRDGPVEFPLAGTELSVEVDGVPVGTVTTDGAGGAAVSYVAGLEGHHVMTVGYVGDASHRAVARSDRFVVVGSAPQGTATVPDAPFLESAIGGQGTVTLTWATPFDGGSPITGYNVYRSATVSGAEEFLVSLGVQNTYVDESVVFAQTYWYVVTAVNAVGESPWYIEWSVIPS
jgi:hypothetical protein